MKLHALTFSVQARGRRSALPVALISVALMAAALTSAALLVGAPVASAQAPAPPPASMGALPQAPSAVMLTQYTAVAAGSGRMYQPTSTSAGPMGVAIEHAAGEAVPLSLDDAVAFTLERNLRLRYDRANQKIVAGEKLTVLQALFPSLSVSADSSAREINLAAMGFKPSTLANIPGFGNIKVSEIVKVNTTEASVSLSQTLFNLEDLAIYRGAEAEFAVADLNRENDREAAVSAVGVAYLRVLADTSTIDNARALVASSQQSFSNASARRQAGVGTSLDQLRAQVDLQQRQQQLISAETAQRKDTIELNRIMGVPAEARWMLTDTVPFNTLTDLDLARARTLAYAQRKDLQVLAANLRVAGYAVRATRYERLPTLAVNGYYGVLGETTGLYHGVFSVTGGLHIPVFREAVIRGDEAIAGAQFTALQQQQRSLRDDVDAQLRASLLDVAADAEQVRVAESSLELAQQEMSDERDRFRAGVDDNLPLVRSEASVAGAQTQVVQALFQYNVAKLTLARNTGVLAGSYRAYLGR